MYVCTHKHSRGRADLGHELDDTGRSTWYVCTYINIYAHTNRAEEGQTWATNSTLEAGLLNIKGGLLFFGCCCCWQFCSKTHESTKDESTDT